MSSVSWNLNKCFQNDNIRVRTKSGNPKKILENMKKVWKIEQMSGKNLDFLGLTSGDKKVQKATTDFTRAVVQRYVHFKFKVRF